MEPTQDEMVDSRTFTLGRKRNIEETDNQTRTSSRDSSLEDDARAAKRVKEDYKHSGDVAATEDEVTVDAAFSSSLLTGRQIPPVTAALRTSVWNKGVQSGLRTSFGNKAHSIAKASLSQLQNADMVSHAIADHTTSPELSTLSATEQDKRSFTQAEGEIQPRKDIPPTADHESAGTSTVEQTFSDGGQDRGDTDMEESMNLSESEALFQAAEIGKGEHSIPSKLSPSQMEHIVSTTTAEEGEIASPGGTGDEMDTSEGHAPSADTSAQLDAILPGSPTKSHREGSSSDEDAEDPTLAVRRARTAAIVDGLPKGDMKQAKRLRKMEEFEGRTLAAEAILARKTLPFPPQHSNMNNLVQSGMTYFPKKIPEGNQNYDSHTARWKLSEILENGRPIRIQNFNFNTFAPAFFKQNLDKVHLAEKKILVSAFNVYVTSYYSHCVEVGGWRKYLTATTKGKNAMSVEEALRLARADKQCPTEPLDQSSNLSTAANDQMAANNSLDTQSVSSTPFRSDEAVVTGKEVQLLAKDAPSQFLPSNDESAHSRHATGTVENARGITRLSSSHPQLVSDGVLLPGEAHDQRKDIVETNVDEVNFDIAMLEDNLEHDLQQKYFPSIIDRPSSYHCLACGDDIHKTFDCPSLTCSSCGGNHAQSTCPLNQRCKRCRVRGHRTVECPEKLARSRDEAGSCELCGDTDHLEEDCHFLWRSFNPKPKDVRVVREIPSYCYSCGGIGHFGPECGLRKPGRIMSGGLTFSKANLMRYIDAKSPHRAISAGVDYSITSKSKATKHFSIKGMANDPIDLDASGDEEVPFIAEKVQKLRGNGKIKIAAPKQQFHPASNYSRQPEPSRQSKLELGPGFVDRGQPARGVDSARHGREPTFSPPPRFDDMRYGFLESDDRFRPQVTYHGEDYYRPQSQQAANHFQSTAQGVLPMRPPMPSGSVPRGGGNYGQGRGGSKRQQGKKPKRGGTKQGRGRSA